MTMQGLGARELGPDLPFTVRAGDRAVTFTLAALRRRWWIPAGVGAAFTVVGATRNEMLGGLIAGGSMVGLIALVLAVVIGAQWLHRNSTITVTSTELIFDGFRRRVLPRAEFSEMVVGFFTNLPTDVAAIQVCFTTREGLRFATVHAAWWPAGGLEQVAAALGATPRVAERPDRALRPWWIRHSFATTATGTVLGIAAITGGIVVYDQVVAARTRDAAVKAEHAWPSYAASHVTASQIPGLISAHAEVRPSDDSESGLSVRTELSMETAEPQPTAGLFLSAHEAVCGFRPVLGDRPVQFSNVIYVGRPRASDSTARVVAGCGDVTPMSDWLGYLQQHPLGPAVERADSGYDDGLLSVSLFLRSADVEEFDGAVARVCAFDQPDGVDVVVSALADGGLQEPYVSGVHCG